MSYQRERNNIEAQVSKGDLSHQAYIRLRSHELFNMLWKQASVVNTCEWPKEVTYYQNYEEQMKEILEFRAKCLELKPVCTLENASTTLTKDLAQNVYEYWRDNVPDLVNAFKLEYNKVPYCNRHTDAPECKI